MTSGGTRVARQVLPTVFGLLMAVAAAAQADGIALAAAIVAVIAVLAGIPFRPVATVGVLLSGLAVMISDSSPMFAAVCGLAAAAYLVLRHTAGGPTGIASTLRPTLIAAVVFAFVGVVATSVPLQVRWLPLLAPPAVVGILALAIRPFVGEINRPASRS